MIEFQRLLLGDAIRNDAFYRALKAAIVPGKTTVADIGSGTGYLSFLAEKLGAKECFLYEVSDLLDLSKTLAKENGIKRCHFFKTHSTEVKTPPKVDVVVSETLGNYSLEENILETMNDARRFLKPGGLMIPESLTQFVAPVTSSRLYDELNVWDRLGQNLDFAIAKEICMNNMYVKEIRPDDLGEEKEWDHVDFRKKNGSVREKIITWPMKKDCTVYGFALWWEATLFQTITLSTSPDDPPTHWKQIYLPLEGPLPVKSGQMIKLIVKSDTRYEVKINLQWETEVVDGRGKSVKKVRQDMRRGYLS